MSLNPSSLIGIIAAIGFDVVGIICLAINFIIRPEIGEGLSAISDWAGGIFFTIWSLVRGGGIVTAKSKKQAKSRILKLILSFLGETIAYIGSLPFWTIFVLSEIKKEGAEEGVLEEERLLSERTNDQENKE